MKSYNASPELKDKTVGRNSIANLNKSGESNFERNKSQKSVVGF
jgi:hypothetical protein